MKIRFKVKISPIIECSLEEYKTIPKADYHMGAVGLSDDAKDLYCLIRAACDVAGAEVIQDTKDYSIRIREEADKED